MGGNIACIAAVLLGIDAGWQPLPEGGLLYLIQIEPELLETLKSGQPIESDFPSYVKDVRGFRITVGTGELPRELPAAGGDSPGSAAATRDQPPTDPFLPPLRQPGAESPGVPNVIQPAPDSKRIDAQEAGYLERPSAVPKGGSKSPSEQEPQREESQQNVARKPWTALIVALFTLFGSLGANLYLGWITWNARSRYRSLVEGRSRPESV